MALIQPLAWEPTNTVGAALKRKEKKRLQSLETRKPSEGNDY